MNRLWPALLPELRRFPPGEQDGALRRARGTALDGAELLGMAAGVVLATALTRYVLPDASVPARLAAFAANFLVAVPLLVLAVGPLHLRRLRRGLREQLQRREAAP